MKNNTFLFYLALGVVLMSCTIVFGFPEKENTQIQQVPEEKVVAENIVQTPTEKPAPGNYLVGIWQNYPSAASGWSDHYNFYPDGKFAFYYNQMDCAKRTQERMGSYIVQGDTLILTYVKEVVNVGGKLVPANGSCASKYELQAAERVTRVLPKPTTEVLKLSNQGLADDELYESINIGKNRYWKLQSDPESISGGKAEFPEWQ